VNIFALEVWDDERDKCTFYTVRQDGATATETDKFFTKYYLVPELKTPVQQLLSFVLESVGNDHGAIDALFNRHENEVVGLPNTGKVKVRQLLFVYPDFPLRLYALRINNRDDIVVLFNGGIKSGRTNQDSKDIHLKWIEACRFAKRIEEALRDGEIIINEKYRKIVAADNSGDIYL